MPWPGCELFTNRRCPESRQCMLMWWPQTTLSGTLIAAATQSCLPYRYRLCAKMKPHPLKITLVNKCTLDNKPHLSCCGVISACAYQPNSMVLAQHIIWVFLCLFIHLLHIPFICGVSFSRHKNLIELILFKLHAPWLFVLQQCYHIILYSCSRTKVVMATIIQNYSPLSALWMWFVLGHIQHNWLASGLIMQTCIWYN